MLVAHRYLLVTYYKRGSLFFKEKKKLLENSFCNLKKLVHLISSTNLWSSFKGFLH